MFGYDAESHIKGSEMDRDSWDALIVNEIDENRPVLYCGQDVSAGHAFVCDGYEMMGPTVYLHINWDGQVVPMASMPPTHLTLR